MSDKTTDKGGGHILVTGGLGFIGSFVTESLVASGNTATVVDSCVSSVIEAEDLLVPTASVEVVTKSVEDYLVEVGNLDNFDMVVHCASYVGPPASWAMPASWARRSSARPPR